LGAVLGFFRSIASEKMQEYPDGPLANHNSYSELLPEAQPKLDQVFLQKEESQLTAATISK
jgi:hypothetical protein